MKRALAVIGAGLGLLLLGLVVFFFWASANRISPDERAQLKEYPAAPAPDAPNTLTVTTYNIGYLSGMTNNQPVVRSDSFLQENMAQALQLLRGADADLIAFQEIDYDGRRSGYVHQLDTIGTRLGYAAAAQAVNWDKRYLPFPYGRPAVNFGPMLSGQSLLSRYPLRQHVRTVLPRPPQPFYRAAFYLRHLAQIAIVDLGGRPLAVMNLHMEAFDVATREEQAREANALYDRLVAAGLPVLVLGDINSVAPTSHPVLPPGQRRKFTGDETLPLLLDGTGLRSVFPDSTYRSDAPPATFPANGPNRKIDHIFYPPALFEPVARTIECRAPSPPSDHCAVTASLRLRPSPADWPAPDVLPRLDTLLTD
jgi:endonuclease/exonuclease/phosphatase family metal-dependent hydrolase